MLEMIGVLAVMAILATVLVPNVVKSLDRASVRVEAQNLRTIGDQIRQYAFDLGGVPTASTTLHSSPPARTAQPPAGSWPTQLAGRQSSLTANELLWNSRDRPRLYVTGSSNRVLVISSMRTSVALPAYNQVSGNFDNIWSLAPGALPPGWPGWNVDNLEYLLIERVNYSREIQTFAIRLNGTGGSYIVRDAAGVQRLAGTSPATVPCRTNERVELLAGSTLAYVYVVSSTGKTFDFNGTTWTPQ